MKKKIIDAVAFSGIWTCPISYLLVFAFVRQINLNQNNASDLVQSIIILLVLLPMIWISYTNLSAYSKDDKRCFYFGDGLKEEMSSEKRKATYPRIPNNMLADANQYNGSIILGKSNNKHVKYDVNANTIPNIIIIGSTGSGKSSSFYIGNLLYMTNSIKDVPNTTEKSMNKYQLFVMDVKGELAKICVPKNNVNIRTVSFDENIKSNLWGWDVYYELDAKSDDNHRLEVYNMIATAVIISTSDHDGFWVENSRTLFVGLLSYFHDIKGIDFIDSVSEILQNNITSLIEEAIEVSDPQSIAYKWLYKFYGKSNNSFEDIITTMTSCLSVFNLPIVKNVMRDRKEKVSPITFDDSLTSIFLNIPDYMLAELGTVFRLITTQLFEYIERRNSSTSLLVLLDEFPALGKIQKICHYMSILRYHNCSIWLSIQSYYQLQNNYSIAESKIIIDNTKIKCVLEISDTDTGEMISKWCGTYNEKKISRNEKGSRSTTTERVPIVTSTDLIKLSQKEEVILIISGVGYLRVKRASYYKDKYMMEIADKIREGKGDLYE